MRVQRPPQAVSRESAPFVLRNYSNFLIAARDFPKYRVCAAWGSHRYLTWEPDPQSGVFVRQRPDHPARTVASKT